MINGRVCWNTANPSKIRRERSLRGKRLIDINDQADPVRVHAHATLRFPPESSTRWSALHRVRLVSYRAVCRDDGPGLVVPSKAHIVCESAARVCRCNPTHSRGTNGEAIRVGRRGRGDSRGCRDACEHGSRSEASRAGNYVCHDGTPSCSPQMDGQKPDLCRNRTLSTVNVIGSTFLTSLIEFFGGGGVRHSSQDPRVIPLASVAL